MRPGFESRRSDGGGRLGWAVSVVLGVWVGGIAGLSGAVLDATGPWVEPEFPFFSSVVDARRVGNGGWTNNLTPRGLILNLGAGLWVCFDTELLRVSAAWKGGGLTPSALAPGSYHDAGRKTPGGQFPAPEPDGKVLLSNGIYPGWQRGTFPVLEDPREPAPTVGEVGRGPLPETLGRFGSVRFVEGGVIIEYSALGVPVREHWVGRFESGHGVVERHVEVGSSAEPLLMVCGRMDGWAMGLMEEAGGVRRVRRGGNDPLTWLRVEPGVEQVRFCVVLSEGVEPNRTIPRLPSGRAISRWKGDVETVVTRSTGPEAYVVDEIGLPDLNSWHRKVRPADIQFLPDGTGVVVTVDGDVWKVRGLAGGAGDSTVRWRRFASGFHEPLTAAIRAGAIFVFDRNGIWELVDEDGDGEADRHRLFSNAFSQTADMREFPSQVRLLPSGGFVIAKGGQQATTLGKHNGSVLEISADGRRATVLGYGFRQPNIGVHPRTGLVTASDQEGQYIPTTPLHRVGGGQFYGYLSDGLQEREQYPAPIAEPLTWIPHAVNASGMSQVWLERASLGPLSGGLVHIGFNRPELFRVLLSERAGRMSAVVVSVTRSFAFPLLNGSVNPVDGNLYLAGFQVLGWGNVVDRLAGVGRVRYTGIPVTLPREVVAMKEGVLLRFDVELDAAAVQPGNFSVSMWGYVRTHRYGSPHLRADGSPGQDLLTPSSAYVSSDRRAVFVGVPGMRPAMQMRIGWTLRTGMGREFGENAYLTPRELPSLDTGVEGFGNLIPDLTPRGAGLGVEGPVSAEEGRRLSVLLGCTACHPVGSGDAAKVGPTWRGLFGREREVIEGGRRGRVRVDEVYIRESLLDPTARVVPGYEKGEYSMPSYAGVVSDGQVRALTLYLKSLSAE